MEIIDHILVTTDFSKASEIALASARDLAIRLESKVTLLHVYDPGERLPPETLPLTGTQRRALERESRAMLMDRLEKLAETKLRGVAKVRTALVKHRNAAEAICDYAALHRASMVVIATRGRGGIERWLIGSTTERVVRHAPCPVFVVRDRTKGGAESRRR